MLEQQRVLDKRRREVTEQRARRDALVGDAAAFGVRQRDDSHRRLRAQLRREAVPTWAEGVSSFSRSRECERDTTSPRRGDGAASS